MATIAVREAQRLLSEPGGDLSRLDAAVREALNAVGDVQVVASEGATIGEGGETAAVAAATAAATTTTNAGAAGAAAAESSGLSELETETTTKTETKDGRFGPGLSELETKIRDLEDDLVVQTHHGLEQVPGIINSD